MAIDRRGFLGALALAPAALAGCAGTAKQATRRGTPAAPPAPAHPPAVPVTAGLAAVRDFPLAADDEPAFVFRAAAARPGEP